DSRDGPGPRRVDKNGPESSLSSTRRVFLLPFFSLSTSHKCRATFPPPRPTKPPRSCAGEPLSCKAFSFLPCSPASTFFLLVSPAQDGNRPRVPSCAQERRRR
uniref:Uncharacterized protein n=1 Tax=Aegilops tauschii subsp. strangulata TaxID=200361 RepID=A0A453PB10_AEGTS